MVFAVASWGSRNRCQQLRGLSSLLATWCDQLPKRPQWETSIGCCSYAAREAILSDCLEDNLEQRMHQVKRSSEQQLHLFLAKPLISSSPSPTITRFGTRMRLNPLVRGAPKRTVDCCFFTSFSTISFFPGHIPAHLVELRFSWSLVLWVLPLGHDSLHVSFLIAGVWTHPSGSPATRLFCKMSVAVRSNMLAHVDVQFVSVRRHNWCHGHSIWSTTISVNFLLGGGMVEDHR